MLRLVELLECPHNDDNNKNITSKNILVQNTKILFCTTEVNRLLSRFSSK